MTPDSPRAFVDGLVAHERAGPGDTVLWIHGYTVDATSWEPLWRLLPGWHHVGVDLPGHGGSRPLGASDRLPALARTIAAEAVARGIQHVVALSFGTIIAIQVAIARPRAFRTLTLGATSLAGGPQDPDVEHMYDALIQLYQARGPGPHLRERWMTSPPPLFEGARGQPALWQTLWSLVGRHSFRELEAGAMVQLTTPPQRAADMRTIEAAALILLGEREMVAFRRCGELIRRAIPGAERRYIPGAGHLCMLEAPEAAAAMIDAHLRAHAVTPPE